MVFGHPIEEVPVYGNVICGDAEKVIYRADWRALDGSGEPSTLRQGERVVDELDVADLVSEKEHGYTFPQPAMGFVTFHVLGDSLDPKRDLFDAGREIPAGETEMARVRTPHGGGRLMVRAAVGQAGGVDVRVDGRVMGRIELVPAREWREPDRPPAPACRRRWSWRSRPSAPTGSTATSGSSRAEGSPR